MQRTNISWAGNRNRPGYTWNFIRGCFPQSPGCANCYAMLVAALRHSHPGGAYEGLAEIRDGKARWTGEVRFVDSKLDEPLRWEVDREEGVFVNSMSDMFHPGFTNEQIAAGFGVMGACPNVTFMVLTKQEERVVDWFEWISDRSDPTRVSHLEVRSCALAAAKILKEKHAKRWTAMARGEVEWPLPNVWLGVSVENQEYANKRLPRLLQVPAAVHWASYEPALGPIDFTEIELPAAYDLSRTVPAHINVLTERDDDHFWNSHAKLDWVVVGGESTQGADARLHDVNWTRGAVSQGRQYGVPVYVKQLGSNAVGYVGQEVRPLKFKQRAGNDPAEWPEDLRVREFPGRAYVERT